MPNLLASFATTPIFSHNRLKRGVLVPWIINERLDVEHQVVTHLCHEIARGAWTPGESLPTPNAIACQYVLNPGAVESAFRQLVKAGILIAAPTGEYVATEDAADLARAAVAESARNEMRDLVRRLRQAKIHSEDIERFWVEAMND